MFKINLKNMTTVTFEESIKISWWKSKMSVYDFIDILVENWFFPKLEKLSKSEITPEIMDSFLASKESKNRINI